MVGALRIPVELAFVLAIGPLLVACTSFHLDLPPAEVTRADASEVVDPQEIVVLVPSGTVSDQLRSEAQSLGFAVREDIELSGLNERLQRYTIPGTLTGAEAITALEGIEPQATAGLNHAYRVQAVAANPLDYADQMLDWPTTGCPALVPVGIIDTSVDLRALASDHMQLVTEDFTRGKAAAARHGTEVAAILSNTRRLTDITLYSAAVIGRSARGQDEAGVDSLLKALDWLAAENVRIVNMSLSGPYNKLLDRGIDTAARNGMVIVAAVGNDGPNSPPRYPAALDNVLAVTAVDAASTIYGNAVRGAHIDVAAPGVDVLVNAPGRSHFVTGTSIAAPFVTARIASDPRLSQAAPDTVRRVLRREARDLGPAGPDGEYGAGLLAAPSGC